MQIGLEMIVKLMTKYLKISCQNLQNITKMAPQIDAKSMKNRGCVFGSFLGWPKGARIYRLPDPSGDHFGPKLEKRHQKRHSKINAAKVSKNDAKMMRKLCQNGCKNQ